MTVRLEASYPATDGSAPENIVIEWTDVEVTGGELAVLVDALARVPRRYEVREQTRDEQLRDAQEKAEWLKAELRRVQNPEATP